MQSPKRMPVPLLLCCEEEGGVRGRTNSKTLFAVVLDWAPVQRSSVLTSGRQVPLATPPTGPVYMTTWWTT